MLPERVPGLERPAAGPLLDPFGRVHTYLRVSVTDRCNYRCAYCMPAAGLDWMARQDLLTYEEITRIVAALARCGIHRVRLTGGEPTVRKGLPELVARLAAIEGITDIAMTTNGHLFAKDAATFARAGLRRVNVSIDSLYPDQFTRLTRGGDLARVLDSVAAARDQGLVPVKINAVIIGNENEDQVDALVDHFAPDAATTQVRFIEYMPFSALSDAVAQGHAWKHVAAVRLRERLAKRWTLEPVAEAQGSGPAKHWRLAESGLIVGFISPITEHFCEACNRLRLQADGQLRTCLSREAAPSLRELLRAGITDEALEQQLRERVWGKVAGHEAHELGAGLAFDGAMTAIGG